jgi:hypothetical protein
MKTLPSTTGVKDIIKDKAFNLRGKKSFISYDIKDIFDGWTGQKLDALPHNNTRDIALPWPDQWIDTMITITDTGP